MSGQSEPGPLEEERNRLLNAVRHLESSNRELRRALEGPADPEYKAAIGENIVVIAKYRARIEALEQEMRRTAGDACKGERVGVTDEGAEPGQSASPAQAEGAAAASAARAAGGDAMQIDAPPAAAAAGRPAGDGTQPGGGPAPAPGQRVEGGAEASAGDASGRPAAGVWL